MSHLTSVPQLADDARVAVYWDFDNILISRFDQIHGRGAYRSAITGRRHLTPELRTKLADARLDLVAATRFLSSPRQARLVTRAYGDWSAPALTQYGPDLVAYGSDLVQLFPVSHGKNGADIRLAIDVVEDLRAQPDITDVIVFAGDSDYIALARHCQRHGRRVIGVGIEGHSASTWQQACDAFWFFDQLVTDAADVRALLVAAMRQLHERHPGEWISQSGVKATMLRLDPTFTHPEHARFSEFVDAHSDLLRFGPPHPTSRRIALGEVDPAALPAAGCGAPTGTPVVDGVVDHRPAA